jgi:predicted amino acid dehydrogenase
LVGNPDSDARKVRDRLAEVAGHVARFVAARHAEGARFQPGTLAAELLARPEPPDEAVTCLEKRGLLVLTQDTRAAIRAAQLVVTATSATGTVVGPADLRPGAVVCDVSRPANISPEVAQARPDVLVLDGGVIAVPGGSTVGEFGLGRGLVYACMAETMMLALAGHLQHTSLGADLPPDSLQLLRTLAERHGFQVARLRSFGRPLEGTDLRHPIEPRAQAV